VLVLGIWKFVKDAFLLYCSIEWTNKAKPNVSYIVGFVLCHSDDN